LIRVMDCENADLDALIRLCEIETIFGRPQGGLNAGRLRYIAYEDAGEKIDLRPFWRQGREPGGNIFNWEALAASRYKWLLNRPDVFPRFFTIVTEERLESISLPPPDSTTDIITTQPIDVLLAICSHLTIKSYLALTSTCRFLRWHALTTLQPHARKLVLGLGWAVATKQEYAGTKARNRATMAHEKDSPHDADWLLYLSHVNRTKSMRVRKWIWALCSEIRRVWMERYPNSSLADVDQGVKSEAKKALEQDVRLQYLVRMTAKRFNMKNN